MADLLNIGLSGLAASKTQLSITGHNITNVNTPGYSRQDATQASRLAQFSGAGYIGSGTTLTDVRRSYSEFLTQQLRSSTALSSDVEAYKTQIDQLDAMLAGSTTGITPSLQKFFSALQTAAEDPANVPARQLVLAEAEGLARRFNTLYDRLYAQNDTINKQMATVTDQVNRLAGGIGQLNEAIAIAAANGKQPNDLLDQRDEAIRQLSEYIGVTVVPQDDSTFNVFVGTGQPLVVGSTVNRLEVRAGTSDPTRAQVDFVSGNSRQTVTPMLTGGELGGLIRYRAQVLDPTFNSLGRLALSISDEVNSQLGLGLDLKGQLGVDLFRDINEDQLVGLRSHPTGVEVRITDTSKLTTSDYEVAFEDSSAFRIRPVGGSWLAGVFPVDEPIGDLGFSISAPADPTITSYTVMPTRRGSAGIAAVLDQPDQLAFAAPLRSEAQLQNKGTGAISQPDLVSVTSTPPSAQPIRLDDLKNVSPLTWTLDGAGNLLSTLPALSAGWSASVSPSSLAVTSGQTNMLEYSLTISDGTTTSVYNISQRLSGAPAAEDRFTLAFNGAGVSDNRNALSLVNLQTKQTMNVTAGAPGSGMTFTDGYGDLVERVGTLTAQSRLDSDATGAILKQATDNRDSLSAVNLDEEAANLIKFEQYYNASAQVIQVARSLFDTLINTFR